MRAIDGRDLDSAVRGLQSVELREKDFPWLNDIVLVHTARSFWKAGRIDDETIEREKFLSRQQMLFEPDHAYGFAFLDYQEQLLPLYQKTKGEQGSGGNA